MHLVSLHGDSKFKTPVTAEAAARYVDDTIRKFA